MQVAHVLLDCVEADLRHSSAGNAGRVAIRDVQIDNQLLTSAHSVVLAQPVRLGHQVRGPSRDPPILLPA
jgi:hypothetical protein